MYCETFAERVSSYIIGDEIVYIKHKFLSGKTYLKLWQEAFLFFYFRACIDLNMENDNCFMGNMLIIRDAWELFTSSVKLFLLEFFFFCAQGFVSLE